MFPAAILAQQVKAVSSLVIVAYRKFIQSSTIAAIIFGHGSFTVH
jgi:hypothetical protein